MLPWPVASLYFQVATAQRGFWLMSISTDTLVKVQNHKGSSAPMPLSKVLTFTDPFPYQSAFRSVDVELFPVAKGEFRAELVQISMSKLWIHGAHENLPRVSVGAVRPDRAAIGFLTQASQPAMQHCGVEVFPGDIIVNDADMMHRRTAANCDWGSMSLTPDDLDAACIALTGRKFSTASPKHLVRPSATLMSRLLKLHGMVGQIAKTSPYLIEIPEVVRALEQELVHVMIRCLTEGESSEMTAGSRRHDTIVARFEEFLEANPDQPLYLTEICAAIGVAGRTLRILARNILEWGQSAILRCGECILLGKPCCEQILRQRPSHKL